MSVFLTLPFGALEHEKTNLEFEQQLLTSTLDWHGLRGPLQGQCCPSLGPSAAQMVMAQATLSALLSLQG